jgi:hypothetical protein
VTQCSFVESLENGGRTFRRKVDYLSATPKLPLQIYCLNDLIKTRSSKKKKKDNFDHLHPPLPEFSHVPFGVRLPAFEKPIDIISSTTLSRM